MKRILFIVLIFFLPLSLGTPAHAQEDPKGNITNQSFSQAKKLLMQQVYYDHRITFYCGCGFDAKNNITETNGYVPLKQWKRAKRLEWEHVVPAHAFGHNLKEWSIGAPACVSSKGKPYKGRKCAEKANIQFRYMQADMYNLYPAVGEINGLRSNYPYAVIPGEERRFGECDMEIEGKKAEPTERIRGNIARTYFYMNWAYPGYGIICAENGKMCEAWDQSDQVDRWECERARRALQKNKNLFVKSRCAKRGYE